MVDEKSLSGTDSSDMQEGTESAAKLVGVVEPQARTPTICWILNEGQHQGESYCQDSPHICHHGGMCSLDVLVKLQANC